MLLSSNSFSDYLDIYERMYASFSQGNTKSWQTLFSETIQQTSTPYELLYMFLDHTLNTLNNKKHKMIVPLIEAFKQLDMDDKDIQFDDIIKENILSKICRRCALNQLESVIEVFNFRSIDNQPLMIDFINKQQQDNMIFISQLTKLLKLLEVNAISFEKVGDKNYFKYMLLFF